MSYSSPGASGGPRPHRLIGMPRVVTALVAAICAAHLARIALPSDLQYVLFDRFGVIPAALEGASLETWVERSVGHAFIHGAPPIGGAELGFGFIHLFFNAMIILQTGELVARRLGRSLDGAFRFLTLFFLSAAGGAWAFVALNPETTIPAVGASGAACGLFAGYLLAAHPDWRVSIRAPSVHQAGFWFVAINVGIAWFAREAGVLPIAWEAHGGGFLAGLLLYPLLAPRWRPRNPFD